MITVLQPLGDRFVAALLTSTYQGVVLTLAVLVVLGLLRRWNAATRYAVLMVTLVTVAALPVLHVAGVPKSIASGPDLRTPGTPFQDSDTPSNFEESRGELDLPPTSPVAVPDNALAESSVARDPHDASPIDPPPSHPDVSLDETAPSSVGSRVRFATDVDVQIDADPWIPASVSWFDPLQQPLALPRGITVALLLLWTAIAGFRLAKLASQCAALRHMKRSGLRAPESLDRAFEAIRRDMGIRRSADLRVLPGLTTPVAAGLGTTAVVLLPEALLESPPADQRRVLRHELAHLLRYDDWTNLLQQTVRALLFFHPAVAWISRRLAVDREIACDDHVLATRDSRRDYALFLTDLARRTPSRTLAVAPAACSNPSQLRERIQMILNARRNASTRPAWSGVGALGSAAALLAVLAFHIGPRVALAQSLVPTPEPVPQPVSVEVTVSDAAEPSALPRASSLGPEGEKSKDRHPTPPVPPTPAAHPNVPALDVGVAVAPGAPVPPLVIHTPGGSTAVVGPGTTLLAGPRSRETRALLAAPGKVRVRDVRPTKLDDAEANLERRLERLEELVESLIEHGEDAQDAYEAAEHAEELVQELRSAADEVRQHQHELINSNEFADVHQHALQEAARQSERAVRDAQRALATTERARSEARKAQRQKEDAWALKRRIPDIDATDIQRQVLESQRASLQEHLRQVERQLRDLDSRIQKLRSGDDTRDPNDDAPDTKDAKPAAGQKSSSDERPARESKGERSSGAIQGERGAASAGAAGVGFPRDAVRF